ncbi:MAG: vitamin K epoxide reductase family protein [Chloroflexia bacterium]
MTTLLNLRLRMAIGVFALVGLLVATYLAIFEIGYLYRPEFSGEIVCPNQGCETVNRSHYVTMFGLPVAVYGILGYLAILVVDLGWMTRREMAALSGGKKRRAAAGALRRWLAQVRVGSVLLGLTGFGFVVSLFLTYLEIFRIHAICTWCMVSAGVMTVLFGLAMANYLCEGRRSSAKSFAKDREL